MNETISQRALATINHALTIRRGVLVDNESESWARWELGHDLYNELRTINPRDVSGALLEPLSPDEWATLFGIQLHPVDDLIGTDRIRLVIEDPSR